MYYKKTNKLTKTIFVVLFVIIQLVDIISNLGTKSAASDCIHFMI